MVLPFEHEKGDGEFLSGNVSCVGASLHLEVALQEAWVGALLALSKGGSALSSRYGWV